MHPPLEGVIHLACPHRFVELAHTVVRLLTVCPVNQNMDSNQHNICHITQLHINGHLLDSVMLCYATLRYVICYVTLRYAMLCYVTLFYVMICNVRLGYVILCYVRDTYPGSNLP